LGLGLSIARQLVELQGGAITVASSGVGRGTTFTLHLPIHQGAPVAEPAAALEGGFGGDASAPYAAGSLAGVTLLVVDDEPDSLELVQQVLAETGARILTATSAAEALRVVSGELPDLLISDIGMPLMDGFELIRRIRSGRDRTLAALPAIALTAFSRREDQQRALEAGYDEYMAKPLRPSVLLQAVVAMAGRDALSRNSA
ncbi:MAG: hybrid sensor histidine kinase/response regulator, partial [Lysobacteraceae bacterium]